MPDPINGVPATIEAGNAVAFLLSYAAFPVADYTLQFVIGDASPKIISATISASQFLVTLDGEVTDDLTPGEVTWAAYASKDGNRYTAESGTMQVLYNRARARSMTTAEKELDHWQRQYALMTRQNQFASPQSQSTQYKPEAIRSEIQFWQEMVNVERQKEAIERLAS